MLDGGAQGDVDPSEAGIDATLEYADAARLGPYEEAAAAAAAAAADAGMLDGEAGVSIDYQCACNAFLAKYERGNTLQPICTQTELILFETDPLLAEGGCVASDDGGNDDGGDTFGEDGAPPGGGCLDCALKKSYIDDAIGTGDTSQECDDLASTASAPSLAIDIGPTAVAQCLAVLACALPATGSSPLRVTPTKQANVSLGNAYCGLATGASCSAGAPQGACVSVMAAGLPATYTPGTQTVAGLADQHYPTGQAGALLDNLAATNPSSQCSTCIR